LTTWTTLADSTLSQDKPLTQSTARAFRDNPIAIAENDASAPPIIGLNPSVVAVASASSSLVFSNLTSDFDIYEFELIEIAAATAGATLGMQFSVDNGANWYTTNYQDSCLVGTATASIDSSSSRSALKLTQDIGGGDTRANGEVRLTNPASTLYKIVHWRTFHGNNSGVNVNVVGGGTNSNTGTKNVPVTAVRFLMSSGSISSGRIVMRPKRKA
jgi:hypothetical protein